MFALVYFELIRRILSFCASSFDFSRLAPAGGKGGDNLTKTDDDLYFMKEMNPGDHKVLVEPEFAKKLAAHVTSPEHPSLIAPIIAHFTHPGNGKIYLALRNCIPNLPARLNKLYDLKGCADDKLLVDAGEKVPEVHKRIWKAHLWCGCGGEPRAKYFNGKLEALHNPHLPLTESQKKTVLEALHYDCEFLKSENLMDYSLIAGVCDASEKVTELNPNIDLYASKPLESKHEKAQVGEFTYLGIIDYLQKWNTGKEVAKAIKSFERNKATIPPVPYAKRFTEHFDFVLHEVDGDTEQMFQRRDARQLPHRCYPLVKK